MPTCSPRTSNYALVICSITRNFLQGLDFQSDYTGEIIANSEIEVIAWLSYTNLERCAPATQWTLDYLYQQQWID